MKKIAIYDFDGTISKHDSFLPFLLHCFGFFQFIFRIVLLAPVISLYFLGLKDRNYVKKMFIKIFFKQKSRKSIAEKAESYRSILLKNTYKSALENIEAQKSTGFELVLLSASSEVWLRPTFDSLFDQFICTKLEIKNGFFTGNLTGNNCIGIEKIQRLKAKIDLSQYETVLVYADSKSDMVLKSVATDFYFQHFK